MTTLANRPRATPLGDEDFSAGVRRDQCLHCWQPISHIDGCWSHGYSQLRCWRRDLDRKVLQEALNTIARLTVEHRIMDADALRVLDQGHRHIAEYLPE